jgi:transposase
LRITRTGLQWRNLEGSYPPWELVYYYFRKWQADGTWSKVLAMLVVKERQRNGRQKQASAAAVDSQSVKKGSLISLDTGVDGAKVVNGRKRHLAVDTLGLPLALHVSSAQVQDGQAGIELLWQLEKASGKLALIRADHAYCGYFEDCADLYQWPVEISQKPETQKGFVPQKGRWQVERSFAWFNFFRRLSKDYEKTTASSLCFMQVAFIDIILNRLVT